MDSSRAGAIAEGSAAEFTGSNTVGAKRIKQFIGRKLRKLRKLKKY
jgi:hypothetical protein